MMTYHEISAGDEVHCNDCKRITKAKRIDFGHGVTEYWGSVSNHVDIRPACAYCESSDVVRPEDVETDEYEEEA